MVNQIIAVAKRKEGKSWCAAAESKKRGGKQSRGKKELKRKAEGQQGGLPCFRALSQARMTLVAIPAQEKGPGEQSKIRIIGELGEGGSFLS